MLIFLLMYSVYWQMYAVGSYEDLLIAFPNIWRPLGCSSRQCECLENLSCNFIVFSAVLYSALCLSQQSASTVAYQLP